MSALPPAWSFAPDLAPAEVLDVPVDGGALAVARWGDGDRVVLLSHGITANHVEFGHLATRLAGQGWTVLAPDHRGRGLSTGVGAPHGLAQHATDLVAIADHAGAEVVDVVGHSMGGFVAAALAEAHPHRVGRLVLVDGGIPLDLPFPEDTPTEEVLDAVIGPAMQRLAMRWDTVDDYVAFWRQHPALDAWDDLVEAYVRHDAVEGDDGVRSRVAAPAITADAAASLDDASGEAIRRVDVPGTFLWCDRGMFGEAPGLYEAQVAAGEADALPSLRFEQVPDVNHYTIVLSADGAAVVAEALARTPAAH